MSKKFLRWVFLIALVLRVLFIWRAPFWYDENFTLLALRLPIDRMLAAIAGDVHPPLFYLILMPVGKIVNLLNLPVWILRLPSVLFSLLALWAFILILRKMDLHPRIQIAATLLMVIMPFQLYYAQEARMYALLEFLILLAFLAMLMKRWVVFGVACCLALYTQNYAMFYIPVLGLIALVRNWPDRKKVFIALALACLAYLPWVLILRGQMGNIQDNYWMRMTSPGLPLLILFRIIFMPQGIAPLQIPLMLVCFSWLSISLISIAKNKQWKLWNIAALAFIPLVEASIVSALWQPVLHYRPLIGSTPFLYILLAYPVNAIFEQVGKMEWVQHYSWLNGYISFMRYRIININKMLYAACFLVPAILVTDVMIYVYAAENKTTDGTVQQLEFIQNHWKSGDIIIDMGDDTFVNTAPYSDLPRYRVPGCDLQAGELSDPTRTALGVVYLTEQVKYSRAWVPINITPLDNGAAACAAAALDLDLANPTVPIIHDDNLISGLWLVQGNYAQR